MSEFRKNFNELEVGYIPEKFNFTYVKKEDSLVDFNKLQYNSLYKNPLFYLNRFSNPQAFLNLPCSQVILQEMIDNSLTPLEEHNYIQLCASIIPEEPK
jgi:hypothetical protein